MLPLAILSYHCDYIKESSFILIIILRLSLDLTSSLFFLFYHPDLDRTVDELLLRFLHEEVSWLSRGRLCPHPDGVVREQWSSGRRTLTLTALPHYITSDCVRRVPVSSSQCFTGTWNMGLHLAEISSPVFELLWGRKRAEEGKYAVPITSFFLCKLLISFVAS